MIRVDFGPISETVYTHSCHFLFLVRSMLLNSFVFRVLFVFILCLVLTVDCVVGLTVLDFLEHLFETTN
jgi:hypothetical protein